MDLSSFFQTASIEWWNVLLAIVAVVLGWILSRVARKAMRALLGRLSGISETLATVTARITGYAILLLGIGVALALLGANVQPLLAIVVIVGIVLVLVLRGVADNFAAGVLIQTRRPIELGDEVVVEGPDGVLTGSVKALNSRSVVVATYDGRTVHVPNLHVMQNPIVNDSSHGARRSGVQVRLERAGGDVDALLARLVTAAGAVDGVHTREPARALAVSISPHRLVADVQFWHHPTAAPKIVSDVVRALAADLESDGLAVTITSAQPSAPLTPPDPL